jgi:hypothetical protein
MRSRRKDTRRATCKDLSLLAATGIVLALLASACGSGSPSQPSSAATTYTQAVKFSQCMRANGLTNWPDPISNGRTRSLNRIDPNSSAFGRAYTACRKDAPSGQFGPPAPTAAELRFALAFARCVRKHGFPQFPDPLTTYGPGFTLGRGMYFPPNGTNQVESSAFTHATKACGVQPPSGAP